MFVEVVFEVFLEVGDGGGVGGLGGDRLIEEFGDDGMVGGGECGELVLFYWVVFVVGEVVEIFKIYDVGVWVCCEGGEGVVEELVDVFVVFFGDGVMCDVGGE